MPFLNSKLATTMVRDAPGDVRVLTFVDPLDYFSPSLGRRFRMLAGSVTDGMSVPRLLTNKIAAHGQYAWPGYLHDGLYHNTVVEMDLNGHWFSPTLTRAEKDTLLAEALADEGCPAWEVEAVLKSVNWGGAGAAEGDLSLPIPHISKSELDQPPSGS